MKQIAIKCGYTDVHAVRVSAPGDEHTQGTEAL